MPKDLKNFTYKGPVDLQTEEDQISLREDLDIWRPVEPEVLDTSKIGATEAFFDNILQGVTYNFEDEIYGVLGGEEVGKEAEKERKEQMEKHPVASIAGQLAGGLLTGGTVLKGASLGLKGLQAAGKAVSPWATRGIGALIGATEGAVGGIGVKPQGKKDEFTWGDVFFTGLGGLLGGIMPPGMRVDRQGVQVLKNNADDLVDEGRITTQQANELKEQLDNLTRQAEVEYIQPNVLQREIEETPGLFKFEIRQEPTRQAVGRDLQRGIERWKWVLVDDIRRTLPNIPPAVPQFILDNTPMNKLPIAFDQATGRARFQGNEWRREFVDLLSQGKPDDLKMRKLQNLTGIDTDTQNRINLFYDRASPDLQNFGKIKTAYGEPSPQDKIINLNEPPSSGNLPRSGGAAINENFPETPGLAEQVELPPVDEEKLWKAIFDKATQKEIEKVPGQPLQVDLLEDLQRRRPEIEARELQKIEKAKDITEVVEAPQPGFSEYTLYDYKATPEVAEATKQKALKTFDPRITPEGSKRLTDFDREVIDSLSKNGLRPTSVLGVGDNNKVLEVINDKTREVWAAKIGSFYDKTKRNSYNNLLQETQKLKAFQEALETGVIPFGGAETVIQRHLPTFKFIHKPEEGFIAALSPRLEPLTDAEKQMFKDVEWPKSFDEIKEPLLDQRVFRDQRLKSFKDALFGLYRYTGIKFGDLHIDNIMKNPYTKEYVVADIGGFDFPPNLMGKVKNLPLFRVGAEEGDIATKITPGIEERSLQEVMWRMGLEPVQTPKRDVVVTDSMLNRPTRDPSPVLTSQLGSGAFGTAYEAIPTEVIREAIQTGKGIAPTENKVVKVLRPVIDPRTQEMDEIDVRKIIEQLRQSDTVSKEVMDVLVTTERFGSIDTPYGVAQTMIMPKMVPLTEQERRMFARNFPNNPRVIRQQYIAGLNEPAKDLLRKLEEFREKTGIVWSDVKSDNVMKDPVTGKYIVIDLGNFWVSEARPNKEISTVIRRAQKMIDKGELQE